MIRQILPGKEKKMETNTRITAELMEGLAPGKIHIFPYDNAGLYLNASRHAYWVRQHKQRTDGRRYEIGQSNTSMILTIKVVP